MFSKKQKTRKVRYWILYQLIIFLHHLKDWHTIKVFNRQCLWGRREVLKKYCVTVKYRNIVKGRLYYFHAVVAKHAGILVLQRYYFINSTVPLNDIFWGLFGFLKLQYQT